MESSPATPASEPDPANAEDCTSIQAIRAALTDATHGKGEVIESLLACLVAGGHALIEDVPGVGKTTLAYALARAIDCDFKRIQFTSDIIPSDIIGVSIYQKTREAFEFIPGPIFSNIVLADEINRASPRSQSALLEAMERGLVSADGITHSIDQPFMVIATQNPVDFESTFPLPSAQLDRFLVRLAVGYPDEQSERTMLRTGALRYDALDIPVVANREDILRLRKQAADVFVEESILDYVQEIVAQSRTHPKAEIGVSPRGSLALKTLLQAGALVAGRSYVSPDDLERYAVPCLAHRIRLRSHHGLGFDWKASAAVVEEILNAVEAPHLKD